jgi:cell division protein FtsB
MAVKGGSSFHVKPIKANSESHNKRTSEMPHVHSELIPENRTWIESSVRMKMKEIRRFCKEKSGRAMYKTAEPIREAVVNLKPHHDLNDVKRLSDALKEKYGIECFQIYIHRDEGLKRNGEIKINHHAHMVFRWQDLNTGKTFKFKPDDMIQMQSFVAETLGMERGEFKSITQTKRLEAIEYKQQQEELYKKSLQDEIESLEQKKNTVRERIKRFNEERGIIDSQPPKIDKRASERRKNVIYEDFNDPSAKRYSLDDPRLKGITIEELNSAIAEFKRRISSIQEI